MKKNNNKEEPHRKRGVLIVFLLIIIIVPILIYMNNSPSQIIKSEYSIGETATIDDITLILKEVNYINNNSGIELTFEITNNQDNTITITPDEYFVFYDINKVQIPNKNTNDKNIVKKDETITYKLQYDVTQKELYEIYFYSQVVENNIKFSFKSSDIQTDTITESNVTPEKSLE